MNHLQKNLPLNPSLITKCPKCGDCFEVTSELLNVCNGLVQCSSCEHIFNGVFYLQNNNFNDNVSQKNEIQEEINKVFKKPIKLTGEIQKDATGRQYLLHQSSTSQTSQKNSTNSTNSILPTLNLKSSTLSQASIGISPTKNYTDHVDFSEIKLTLQQKNVKKIPKWLQICLILCLFIGLLCQIYIYFKHEIHAIPFVEKLIEKSFSPVDSNKKNNNKILPLYLSKLQLLHEYDNFEKKNNNRLLFQGVIENTLFFSQAVPQCHIQLKNKQGQTIFQKTFHIQLLGTTEQKILPHEQHNFDLEFLVNPLIHQETERYVVTLK
jgi:predicted Zn finger-like uncharacterized protein